MKHYPEAFDFDPVKSLKNWWKHGQLLAFATLLWLDRRRLYLETRRRYAETRFRVIAQHEGEIWTCVFTLREGVYRLISLRPASKKEAAAYRSRAVRPGLRKR